MKMIELLDQHAKQYLTGLNNRSVQVDALNKLLTTNYREDAKDALSQSGFTDGMLSARQMHSLIVNNAATWLVDVLSGNWTPCPIAKNAGLNQAKAITWFKEHGEATAERIATKKAQRAKARADAKAKQQPEEKEEAEETFTQSDLEQAFREGQRDALQSAYAFTASDINKSMIVDLIECLDHADREWLLAELAAKYPNASKRAATKRGKGTQPTLPV